MRIFTVLNSRPTWSYLRAGCFLHFMTLVELTLLCLIYSYFSIYFEYLTPVGIFFKLILMFFLAVLSLFSQLDARSRFQNYKQLKDQLFFYGFDRRIFKPVLQSRCQRDAAMAAAEELGYGNECRNYFRTCGYRWYHLVPDFIFRAPYFLLTWAFWRRTFFMPTYRSRVDFKMMVGNVQLSLKVSPMMKRHLKTVEEKS
ncbi:MAG: hypothetical protein B6240_07350 [Desulfobacteraceae bacterium 4572_87]|nr:MAG: hypothetical protein B6240_07350 [Desulfobacteraceae bacterium 4572_87]